MASILKNIGFIFGVAIICSSCGNAKKAHQELLYMRGNLDTLPNKEVLGKEAAIQAGDLLSIIVYSDNPEATAIFNQPQITPPAAKTGAGMVSGEASVGSPVAGGYPVDIQGNIRFQNLGTIHVAGLTRLQLMQLLTEKLSPYLKNAYTDIRFLNFRVTVIGEVQRPAVYIIPEEKISILELMGMAGDLTIYGKRDDILVIREKEGKRSFGHINLKDANLFQSPYFYLQQNDVVYIEPVKNKQTASDLALLKNITIVSAIAAVLTSIAIVATLFK